MLQKLFAQLALAFGNFYFEFEIEIMIIMMTMIIIPVKMKGKQNNSFTIYESNPTAWCYQIDSYFKHWIRGVTERY